MPDVFISYSREDRPAVQILATVLTQLGLSVWWDPHLSPGQEFDAEIAEKLLAAKSVIVVWSARSVNSRWVKGEARDGADRGKLIPIAIDGASPPIDFRSTHTIDLRGWSGDPENAAFKVLVDSIERKLPAPLEGSRQDLVAREFKARRRVRTQKYLLVVLVPLVLGVLAFGYDAVLRAATAPADAYAVLVGDTRLPSSALASIDRLREPIRETVKIRLDELLAKAAAARTANQDVRLILDAWDTAQMSVAALETAKSRSAEIKRYFADSMDRACACWSPIDGGQHAVTTAWILISHAELGIPVDPPVLAKILGAQSADGSWPLYFDAAADQRHASTYATAFLALALHKVAAAETDETRGRLGAAIARAGSWLFSVAPEPGARWLDYPKSQVRQIRSRGISAFAVYVFMQVFRGGRAEQVARNWASTLATPDRFDSLESSDQYITLTTGLVRRDTTRYVVWGWELASLAKSYEVGTSLDRYRARRFARTAAGDTTLSPETLQLSFLMAESLFALRDLRPE